MLTTLTFFINIPSTKNQTIDLTTLFSQISEWCDYSGAQLFPTKCKHLHICRKHNCSCHILTTNYQLTNINCLKILAIHINNKYNFHDHTKSLKASLEKKIQILKCLSNQKFNCHTSSLINVTKAIII